MSESPHLPEAIDNGHDRHENHRTEQPLTPSQIQSVHMPGMNRDIRLLRERIQGLEIRMDVAERTIVRILRIQLFTSSRTRMCIIFIEHSITDHNFVKGYMDHVVECCYFQVNRPARDMGESVKKEPRGFFTVDQIFSGFVLFIWEFCLIYLLAHFYRFVVEIRYL
ncbi:hypothetical protein BGX38DRAFT_1187594 [Terfezia claveryi]|nr:hypothetical protein BGX38DRAFT_1187594 [Terfezia claveryi]